MFFNFSSESKAFFIKIREGKGHLKKTFRVLITLQLMAEDI